MAKVIIHTDGSCIGNPGPGGWAATLQLVDSSGEVRAARKRVAEKIDLWLPPQYHEQPDGTHGSDPRAVSAQIPWANRRNCHG